MWIPEEEAGDYGMEAAGWLDADSRVQAEKTFVAGEGFVISNDYEGDAIIKMPGAI